jgi:uncharacterized membrane protein
MKTRYFGIAALMVVAAAVAFGLSLGDLPARVPVHWNVHGQVDRFAPPWELFVVGPALMAFVMALFALLPIVSPRRFEVDAFATTYLTVMLVVVALQGYVFFIMLRVALGTHVDMPAAIVGGLAVMSILIGNVLGKVRRNFFIGIRTPWTLASERVWYATHRLGAKLIIAAGIAALAMVLAGAAPWLAGIVLAAGYAVPVAYSLACYKKLEREGGLNGPTPVQ